MGADKNFGWNFLNSKDGGFINGEDGDSYRYSDGSGYYYGADGSDGYRYSDGTGYYNSASGSRLDFAKYDSDEDDGGDDDYYSRSSDSSTSWSDLLATADVLGAAVCKKKGQEKQYQDELRRQEEEWKREEKRAKRKSENAIKKKSFKALLFNKKLAYDTEVIITYHEKRVISFPFSVRNIKGMNYTEIGDKLQELGFTEIYEKPIKDLVMGWMKKMVL